MKRLLVFLSLVALLIPSTGEAKNAKLRRHHERSTGEYSVILNASTPVSEVAALAEDLSQFYDVKVEKVWPYSLRGFLVRGAESHITALSSDSRVEYGEENAVGEFDPGVSATQWTTFSYPEAQPGGGTGGYQWNLDRLDELTWALSNRDSTYNMCTEGGAGYAYVLDTGVYSHNEFGSRLVLKLDFVGSANGAVMVGEPCSGPSSVAYHGTAVASVLAGANIGAAKPKIVSLRINPCNGSGNPVDYIEALEWIAGPNNPYKTSPGVINHSGYVPVWSSNFQAYGDAVANVVNGTNIPFFASANNFGSDACQFAPANRAYTANNRWLSDANTTKRRVFVVGGTSMGASGSDSADYRWQTWNSDNTARIGSGAGSNSGACVSAFAPAAEIDVAYYSGPDKYVHIAGGTSFAAPAVAGIAIRYMQQRQAATGVIPSALQVYNFLLNSQGASVVNTTTPPTYWLCARTTNTADTVAYPVQQACPSGYSGPYQMPSVTNTSGAKMVYWDEGTCWP